MTPGEDVLQQELAEQGKVMYQDFMASSTKTSMEGDDGRNHFYGYPG